MPSLLPKHLSHDQAQGLVPNELIAQFEIGDYKNFVYLIIDWKSQSCAVVDPQSDLNPIYDVLRRHSLKLSAILLTHTHHDHVAGLSQLLREFPEIPLYLHEKDAHRIASKISAHRSVRYLRDEETFHIGSISVLAMHTPGHSAGECSYFLKNDGGTPYVFTGDTVFIRDCGRTDFPDGSNEQMFESLQRFKKLPAETVILCGHHYQRECASTIAVEIQQSAPFRCGSVSELQALP